MKKDQIALVGAGEGGTAILNTLLKLPEVEVKYVYDINAEAPGIVLAKKHNIKTSTDLEYTELRDDFEMDLIFEVTGVESVYQKLLGSKCPKCSILGASATKIIFHLLDAQNKVTRNLEELKKTLEQRIVERTKDIEKANKILGAKILEYESLNTKLQQVNNEKTKYLLASTHQLKAPFAAIQSYVDIILDGYAGEIPDETKQIVQKIKRRCVLLSESIKEMLELANLKSCITDNLKTEACNIVEIVETVISTHIPIAEKKKILLHMDFSDKIVQLNAVKDQMSILFATLIENAINYSNPDSQINIFIMKAGSIVIVTVQDFGIGINPSSLDKVFNEYFRTNEAVKKHENGTGLGLSIAKEIAIIHRGSISVTSEIGKGSIFTVTLHGIAN